MPASPELTPPPDVARLIDFLSHHALPVAMKNVVVEDGKIRADNPDAVRFSFAFAGAMIDAVGQQRDGRMCIDLAADLGPLPYSVELPAARQAILSFLHDLAVDAFETGADGVIRFRGHLTVQLPVTPAELVGAMTAYMIAYLPQFDRLAAALAPATLTDRRAGAA